MFGRAAHGLERAACGAAQAGRRSTDRERLRGWIPSAVLALSVAFLDWGVKWWVAQTLPLGSHEVVLGGRVALWHVRNDAMILGLYGDLPLESRQAIAAMAAVLGTVLLLEVLVRGHRLPRSKRPWAWTFVGLAAGGMLGNLGERAVHWGVTDYLSLRWNHLWLPPGNIADIAIFLSVPVAALVIVFELQARMRRADRRENASTPSLAIGSAPSGS